MADGKGCTCAAYYPGECACDADWTTQEVYDLRAELTSARHILAAICKANGGEAYISRATLAALGPKDSIERRDEPDGGIYFKLVPREP
jgi:hypothetical protein